MFGIEIPAGAQAYVAIAIIAAMLVMFVRERFPVEVTALGGAALMLVTGILPQDDALAALSNNAPWTIAAMFIIVGGLVRTGALDWVTQLAVRHAETRPRTTLACATFGIVAMSAFMNNTPIVVVMIPVFMQLARQLKMSASKVMIPLSYLAIFGGTVTLIGTSTNLLVDGVVRRQGMAPFGIFEITPLGLAMSLVGIGYLMLFARRALPDRDSMGMMLSDRSRMKFFTEVVIPEGSDFVGQAVAEVDLFQRDNIRVVDVLRGDASLRRAMAGITLRAGDRVVLRTPMSEVLSLAGNPGLRQIDTIGSVQTTTVEVLITPGCRMVGRSLGSMRLRRRYGVYPLAVHRRNQNIGRQLDDLVVQVGDTLLLEGAQADIGRLAADMDLVDISTPTERAYRRRHAPIVIGVLAAVVGLSALEVAPIVILALIGVVVILVTRCIDADEAFGFIDGRLLAMIFAMLAVGQGLDHSGAVQLVVDAATPALQGMPPQVVIFAVYALTSVLTEVVSNNAVAVILTPVALGLGASLGVDSRPLVVAVMFGASASFATPIGYQTNTLVYGPGGYRFTDFLRIGVSLNLLMMVVMSTLIPVIFPF